MRLVIRHRTEYRYSRPLAYAIQTLRLSPRTYDGLAIISWQVRGERQRELPSYIDGLGNVVHSNSLNRPHDRAAIAVEGVVETRATDGGIVRDARETLPAGYFLRRTGLTGPDESIARLAAEASRGTGGMDRLVALMEAVADRVAYRKGVTDAGTSASEALARGSGVCQDHAHLFIACCRALGIPARYVGGYLWTGRGGDEQASHAWAEAWLDEQGWIGFDPANNASPGESYIRVAIGLDYWQAAPVRGIRRGDAEESLAVKVAISATDSVQ